MQADRALPRCLVFVVAMTFAALPLVGPAAPSIQTHDLAKLIQIGLLVGCAAFVLGHAITQRHPIKPSGAITLLICSVFAVLLLAGVANAQVQRAAILELALLVLLILFSALVARVFVDRDITRLAGWLLIACSALLSFAIGTRYLAGVLSEGTLLREQLIPGYSNYRFHNHVQCVTIPLLAVFVARPGASRAQYVLGFTVLALEFCWLAFTGGRATMLALAAGVCVVTVVYRFQSWRWLRAFGSCALVGAVLYWVLFAAVPSLFGIAGDYTALDTVERSVADTGQTRKLLWDLALRYIAESPWIGIGPMHFAHRINPEAAHPHNIYLQIAAEWGLPVLAIVLVFAGLGMRRLVRATRRSDNPEDATLGVGLTAACVAIAVDGAFSGNFVMPNSQLWIAFALGLAAAYVVRIEVRNAPAISRAPVGRTADIRWPIVVATVLSQVALWQGVWPEILDVSAHVDRVRAEIVTNERDNPRFWSHGWFK